MTRSMFTSVVRLTAKEIGVPAPEVIFGQFENGTAYTDDGYMTIPTAILKQEDRFGIYLAVHETCHFFGGGLHHGRKFRNIEDKALASWGVSVTRGNGPYPTSITIKAK